MKSIPRQITYLAAGLLLAPIAAIAQSDESDFGERRGHGRMKERVVQYLELDEAQQQEWEALQSSVDSLSRDAIAQVRDLQEQIEAELGSAAPDAESIGRLMIEAHASREGLRTLREDFDERFSQILHADQLERWEALKALRSERESKSERGPRGRHGQGRGFRGR